MSDTPDLSRIVNLILDNPRLVEEISRMARADGEGAASEVASEPKEESVATGASSSAISVGRDERRGVLISALKPYLSESRSKAIDSMMSVARALEMIKPR